LLPVLRDPIGHVGRLFRTYGPVVSLAAGGGTRLYSSWPECPGTVFVYRPDHVQKIDTQADVYHKHPLSLRLFSRAGRSARTEPLRHYGTGLFGVNDGEHRRHRRILMPSFQKTQVETYRDRMVSITEETIAGWRIGEARDIAHDMRLLSLRIASALLFGGDLGPDSLRLSELIAESLRLLTNPSTLLFAHDLPGLPYRRFLDSAARIDAEMRALIARRRESAAQPDVLSTLIRARDEDTGTALDDDELLGHTESLLAAAHETSANALTWTLLLLSQHPAVHASLVDELRGVLRGSAPAVNDLARLPLLDRVLKESMRVITAVPFNGRIVAKPTELGGYSLPTGTEVLASIYHTHHMEELYPRPQAFDPGRWERTAPSTFEYHPFSAGARACIGATFAQLELKVVLALILQRFRVELAPRARIDATGLIVLTPRGGLPITLREHDGAFQRGVGGVQGNVRSMVDLPA
jgi:cytochrome P450